MEIGRSDELFDRRLAHSVMFDHAHRPHCAFERGRNHARADQVVVQVVRHDRRRHPAAVALDHRPINHNRLGLSRRDCRRRLAKHAGNAATAPAPNLGRPTQLPRAEIVHQPRRLVRIAAVRDEAVDARGIDPGVVAGIDYRLNQHALLGHRSLAALVLAHADTGYRSGNGKPLAHAREPQRHAGMSRPNASVGTIRPVTGCPIWGSSETSSRRPSSRMPPASGNSTRTET